MKPLRQFTVRATLPDSLSALTTLANNLRWSWDTPTQRLFESMDPAAWASSGNDPIRMLGEISGSRLAELAADDDFRTRLDACAADLDDYLSRDQWLQHEQAAGMPEVPGIAYFSMEFGISEVLPIYSGGLGILAGDHLKSASELGLPLVGVGLLYRNGYFHQSLNADGWQVERYPTADPQGLPLTQLTEPSGAPVTVTVSMPDHRTLRATVWIAQVGRIPLLLLDSNLPENDTELRTVTDRLYGGDQDHRIKQEILLGVGGVRAVRRFTALTGAAEPTVFHMNEGHGGFLGIERIRELVARPTNPLTFAEAVTAVRSGTVFTTHTPVPAGIDRFPDDLVRYYLGDDAGRSTLFPGLGVADVVDLGREQTPGVFNMAHLGLRLAQRSNGVSQLHGAVSREMFADLWPGFEPDEVPIGSVTNGVHGRTWISPAWREAAAAAGADVAPDSDSAQMLVSLKNVSDDHLWATRNMLRAELVSLVRDRVRRSGLERGFSEAELSWTEEVFDPDILTIGFARRAATYKRLTLMLRDPDRLKKLLLDPERPIQLVVAGKAHPADNGGKSLIQQMVRFADDPQLRTRMVFLPDYDISMARYLYHGCDVWLNNPLRPMEACGTSGMKSAINGGLNLSILDGWWDEMADGDDGWAIPTADGVADENRRDDLEAAALYRLLEESVVPGFYDRTAGDPPGRWMEMVRHTLSVLGPKILATRMVRDYTEAMYVPASQSYQTIRADDYAAARTLADYTGRVRRAWPSVRIAEVDSTGLPDVPVMSSKLTLTAHVRLGDLAPSDVRVQAVLGRVEDDTLSPVSTADMVALTDPGEADGAIEGETLFRAVIELPTAGRLGYTVRVLPHNDLLASDADLGLVRLPEGMQ